MLLTGSGSKSYSLVERGKKKEKEEEDTASLEGVACLLIRFSVFIVASGVSF